MLLYIHIPYCDSKCHYCSFNSYVDKFQSRQAYMIALQEQLDFELQRFNVQPQQIESLFIGGGTPSTVAPSLYAPLFKRLDPLLKKDAEITTEANPNSATSAWLEGMRALGVNRLSFGVQSFNPTKLKALNRAHSPQQAIEAIETAHRIGFTHLSLDLIYNYTGDTEASILADIKQAFSLPIDHISAYELTIEANTPFAATPEVRQEKEALAFFVADEITKRGFTHYEISNFGSYQSRHNQGYWELKNYMGVGAGAVGFLETERFYPHTNIDAYITDPLYGAKEPLTEEALLTEKIFLGLRSSVGVEKEILPKAMRQRCDILLQEGKLTEDKGRYYNPNFFVADALALYLLD